MNSRLDLGSLGTSCYSFVNPRLVKVGMNKAEVEITSDGFSVNGRWPAVGSGITDLTGVPSLNYLNLVYCGAIYEGSIFKSSIW